MKTKIILALIVILGLLVTPASGLAVTSTVCGAGINNLPPCCYEDETGWGAGLRYVPRGNWATYTPYDGQAQSVILYAGQTMNAGTIYFSDPVDGMVTITIQLKNAWHFDFRGPDGELEESVHIQDYIETPPAENPAPGQFAYKFIAMGGSFSTTLPEANFYGIHVALIHVVPCPPIAIGLPAVSIR